MSATGEPYEGPMIVAMDLEPAQVQRVREVARQLNVALMVTSIERPTTQQNGQVAPVVATSGPQVAHNGAQRQPEPSGGVSPIRMNCESCGEFLRQETRFRDGTVWTDRTLAEYGKRKHKMVLCMPCYRMANDRLRAGE